ncbi:CoA pyrophosphatase [Flavobacterium sp. HSC-61S13]|uniref:NUDIX hydrolase n=1 Tax=Flavobacterium sp. HSC-61S13 TaxID=2910963 RepID=UPI0020A10C21|nr:CoA pyrophosphatase [Flavobacterium sp. HSC-61S13]MCP1996576.1 8-oxo-dGTP pyrophosphatase MutT (NUDIX family) [Flavobacterium sp. HSC-61S13]
MDYDQFIKVIPAIKAQPLFALKAHIKMAPLERIKYLETEDYKMYNPKKSAVLMLLYPKDNKTNLLLIERAEYPGIHSSQIAFPGGKKDFTDQNLTQTALRETWEEVGISKDKIEIIKPFSEIYIPPSNFIVSPFLGFATANLEFVLQPKEVAQIIEMPLDDLLDDGIIEHVKMNTSYAVDIDVPAYLIEKHIVWGATAMMLSELKETLRKVLF